MEVARVAATSDCEGCGEAVSMEVARVAATRPVAGMAAVARAAVARATIERVATLRRWVRRRQRGSAVWAVRCGVGAKLASRAGAAAGTAGMWRVGRRWRDGDGGGGDCHGGGGVGDGGWLGG